MNKFYLKLSDVLCVFKKVRKIIVVFWVFINLFVFLKGIKLLLFFVKGNMLKVDYSFIKCF